MYNNHSKDLDFLANSFLEQAINADFGENNQITPIEIFSTS